MSVLLAVPTRGTISWATVTRLEEIRDLNPELPPILYQPGNLSVALTRNKIVRAFLEGPWDVLAMVDDDVVPPPTFLDVAKHVGEDFGLVAVPHVMPAPDRASLIFTIFDTDYRAVEPREGLNACWAAATGAVMISRAALEALGPDPFRIEHRPDAPIQSDDFLFCVELHRAGFGVGYWWDGFYADHHSVTQLAPLIEARVYA